MALDKAGLITALENFLTYTQEDPVKTPNEVATELADAIDTYTKTGQVIVSGGSSAGTYPVT